MTRLQIEKEWFRALYFVVQDPEERLKLILERLEKILPD